MEKELMRLYEAVKKAADAAATSTDNQVEENRCLDAFKLLKKFPVNLEILRYTQVGKHLRVLTKHPRKKIQAFAKNLVDIWKGIVLKEISENKKQKVYQKISKAEKKQVSEILKRASPRPTAPLEQKTMIKIGDVTRDKIREILQEALSRVSGEADEAIKDQVNACDPIRVSVSVESIVFQKWGSFNKGDRSIKIKYRSLMFNLKDPNNKDFRRRVLLGEFKLDQIVNMRTEDMASDERKKEIEEIRMRALLKCKDGQELKGTTDQFVCGKCRKRECTYYQMQTRSADEPMTTYVTCVSCNHHWKFC
ncbi:hypothetical protein QN277_000674 [Acacia crassicarpa]|uniref:Transcription elongation factor n=1 Tax=Acacia crassicarpa TaxID=499986 RepID=A0AAE1N706_9FABA|nr:hypothetical protein QN277_000674 [Acacia crassicarpa]